MKKMLMLLAFSMAAPAMAEEKPYASIRSMEDVAAIDYQLSDHLARLGAAMAGAKHCEDLRSSARQNDVLTIATALKIKMENNGLDGTVMDEILKDNEQRSVRAYQDNPERFCRFTVAVVKDMGEIDLRELAR